MATKLTEDRARVLRDLNLNMVVEAGAGTGKTTLLITRICLAVLAQGIAVDKIVALTFTEKAAAEIKTRLVTALHQIVRDIQDKQEGKEIGTHALLTFIEQHFNLQAKDILPRAQAALSRLDRAGVGTIHSFCADILRTFPLEAGLSPQAEIDSGGRAERVFNARWNAFLDEELGVNAPRKDAWKKVLPEISLPELKAFTQELCSGKIEQYDYFSHAAMLAGICEEKAAQARAWSSAYLDPKRPQPRNIEKALLWAEKTLQEAAQFLRGKENLAVEQTLPPTLTSTLPKGWEEDAYEEARGLVQFALKVRPSQQAVFRQALALVGPVAQQIRADYAREGILSFDDLIVKTRRLVQDNLYVRRLLKEKLDVLFIDEFQDTDPVQGELLLFLAEEKSSSATRWQDVKLEPGKLIVVGDPKQSIYRFRGADITAYELFTRLILSQGGVKCFLRNNYRSVPDIVTVANEVCQRAMVQQSSFQPAYEPIVPTKSPGEKSVQWLFVCAPQTPGVQADDLRDNQAEQIAGWIKQNVGRMKLAGGETLAYKDIAILTRAATTAGPYMDALRRHGIVFNADSEKDFFKRQEINDFLNFLRVTVDPSDTTSLVGVLRSPLGGFTDEEIYQLARRGELSVYAKTAEERAARLYKLILDFAGQVGRADVQKLLERVLDHTSLPELCAAAYEGEQTLEILTRLVAQAQNLRGEGPASLGQFLAGLQDTLQNAPETFSSAPLDALDAVSVMTVHKSKGLDFPVVILADLSKKETGSTAAPSSHLFSWQYNMHGLRAGKICDANLAFLEEEQKKHERCEEVRILYVALTRAKEKLLLVADGRKGAEKAARAFVQAGLWPDGKTDVLQTPEVTVAVSYAAYEDPARFIYRAQTAEETVHPGLDLGAWKKAFDARKSRYEKLLSEQNLSPSERVETNTLLAPEQQAAAEVGTVCHRAMQILLTQPQPDAAQVSARAARETGLVTREQTAAEIIGPFVTSDVCAQLRACKLIAAEMPFSYAAANGLVESGVIDAVLERPDGTIWVVDYKTDKIPTDGIQKLVEKYRPQLAVYQAAAQKLFPGKEVVCSAVFLRACKRAEVN